MHTIRLYLSGGRAAIYHNSDWTGLALLRSVDSAGHEMGWDVPGEIVAAIREGAVQEAMEAGSLPSTLLPCPWISVEDVPEPGMGRSIPLLLLYAGGATSVGYAERDAEGSVKLWSQARPRFRNADPEERDLGPVTHWMPVPAPPVPPAISRCVVTPGLEDCPGSGREVWPTAECFMCPDCRRLIPVQDGRVLDHSRKEGRG